MYSIYILVPLFSFFFQLFIVIFQGDWILKLLPAEEIILIFCYDHDDF